MRINVKETLRRPIF